MSAKTKVALDPVDSAMGAFRNEEPAEGIRALQCLLDDSESVERLGLPLSFLRLTVHAIENNDWTDVGKAFLSGDFIGREGRFLLIAPYKIVRSGKEITNLTGIYGTSLPVPPMPDFGPPIEELFGTHTENVVEIVPFRCFSAFGLADGNDGEAFIVPDGWCFPGAERGQALNNMTAQQDRFEQFAEICLDSIFAESSKKLLLAPFSRGFAGTQLRHREFQFHEAGHASGIGLRRKINTDVLRTTWYRGVEEWRADGVEFELLAREFSPEEAGRTIAANYCLRFGLDAHRKGGIERDTDVMASMLTLNSLLKTRSIYITKQRKLAFRDETFQGLLKASIDHREDAIQLTRDELTLEFEQGVWGLFGSIDVDRATRIVFDGLVRLPCQDFVSNLR